MLKLYILSCILNVVLYLLIFKKEILKGNFMDKFIEILFLLFITLLGPLGSIALVLTQTLYFIKHGKT